MKQVPFKCRFGHVTIKEFFGPTLSEIVCDECIAFNSRINNGEAVYNYYSGENGVQRGGAALTRKIPDGEKAYRY